jgi:glyoxylase-like metal-dependent hydrolase (beta-lactamase superfamily II)
MVLADVMSYVPYPGFGPFESYEADHTVNGGEQLSLAGLDIDVLFTPGHSPGHVTYAVASAAEVEGGRDVVGDEAGRRSTEGEPVLLSGDVLFAGSVGRVDLPGGDWSVLERSIAGLLEAFAPETMVYPGHMGVTTLGRERDTNPFLSELRASKARATAGAAPDAPAARS